jgi:hypothetical protein
MPKSLRKFGGRDYASMGIESRSNAIIEKKNWKEKGMLVRLVKTKVAGHTRYRVFVRRKK